MADSMSNLMPEDLCMSALPDCYGRRRVRVWRYATGALRRSYDESLEAAQELQRSDSPLFSLDPVGPLKLYIRQSIKSQLS